MKNTPRIIMIHSCNQNWDEMILNKEGRHCNLCHKTVIDFRHNSIQEIQNYSQGKKQLCGLFKIEQLDPDLIDAEKIFFPLQKFIVVILSFISYDLIGNNLQADKVHKSKNTPSINQALIKAENSTNNNSQKTLPIQKQTIVDDTHHTTTIAKSNRRRLYFSKRFPFIHYKKQNYPGRYFGE